MFKLFLTSTLILLSLNLLAVTKYGGGADKSKVIAISKLLASPKKYIGKEVTVSGTITAVCRNRGCWMTFASDKKFQTLRIKVMDGKMVFPVSLRGNRGYATGIFKAMTLPVERARRYLNHMAEERGEKFDPNTIKEPYIIYQLVPHGVTVE